MAFNELHGVKVDAAVHADRKNGHNVVVAQVSGGKGLVTEAFELAVIKSGGKG